jgi:glycosyltransferase involved in cell wall biosynthesis
MTGDSPYITIIIPTFRAAKTLRVTLDSVLYQDFRDFEVLVMDGGSDDGTAAIVQQAADDRIRFVSERDKGVYDAMNKGILAARGVWLYFLGADDLLYGPGVLSAVFGAAGHEDADLLYGDVVSPSYKGRYDGQFDFPKLLSRNISHQAIFYRRSLFDRFGGYDLNYPGYADWDLNIRLFAAAGVRIRYIDAIIARFGPDGISSRHDSAFLREVLFPNKLRLLEERGMKELRPLMAYDEVWRLLRNGEFVGVRSPGAGPAAGQTVPVVIRQMAAWQEHIPRRILRIGPLSKTIMLTSYLRHLLSGALN